MKRRQFLTTACAAGLAAATMRSATAAQPSSSPHFLDFRMITFPNAQKLEAYTKYYGDVMVPTIARHGISPVGLFVADFNLNSKERNYNQKYDSVLFSLISHPNFDSTQDLAGKMRTDAAYLEAAAAITQGATSRDPLFAAHERMLLRCFPEFPAIKVPSLAPNRILQLRMYRSHSFERSRAKAQQIAKQDGALQLFEECGIKTVFMSTTLYGAFMPSLVFMLYFESEEQKNDAWAKFVNHPEWKKLAADPAYADSVTEVINIFLKPAPGSQI